MPAYSEERTKEYMARIRLLLVKNPKISGLEVQRVLAADLESPLQLDKNYVAKLIRKIHGERANRIDKLTLDVAIAKYEDEGDAARAELWAIINDIGVEIQHRINAIRALREISTEIFEKMFDAGVFERQLGKIKTENDLTPEQEAEVEQALNYVYRYKKFSIFITLFLFHPFNHTT